MKLRAYLDVNVLLDYFLHREPWYEPARVLLELGAAGALDIGVGASTVAFLYYKLGRDQDPLGARERIKGIIPTVTFVTLNDQIVRDAIADPEPDLEDALQLVMAGSWDAEFLITRDRRAFKQTKIRKLSPAEFLDEFVS